MNFKRIIAAAAAGVLTLSLTGCFGFGQQQAENGMVNYNFKEMNTDFIQLKPPTNGDTIAIIDTDLGEVRVVLYPQYAPNTVHNFVANAEAGKYDNIPVKGVSKNTYFLTGGKEDAKGNYIGRDSKDELIDNEYSVDLWPFTGALLSFSEISGQSDARWFMVNNDEESLTEEAIAELKKSAETREDELERANLMTMFDTFYQYGGVFGLAGVHTIFGQTYLGLDVVKQLTNIKSGENGQAEETILIKSITIDTFKDGDATDEYPRPTIHDKPVDTGVSEASEASE